MSEEFTKMAEDLPSQESAWRFLFPFYLVLDQMLRARLNADSLHLCNSKKNDSQNLSTPIGLTNWMAVTSGFLPEINWRNVLQAVLLSSTAKKHLDNASLQEEKGRFFFFFPEKCM